ncbi:MAG: eS25 family ribosomal protein [Candidatus Helarchaeota archaeon]
MGKGKKSTKSKSKSDSGKSDKKKSTKAVKKWGVTTKERDITKRDVFITDEVRTQMESEIPKMKEITISKISMKYNIVQSIAKKFLEELHRKKMIKLIARNSRISIYTSLGKKPAKAKSAA